VPLRALESPLPGSAGLVGSVPIWTERKWSIRDLVHTVSHREIGNVFFRRSVQFLFPPLSDKQVVGSGPTVDRGNWVTTDHDKQAHRGS